MVQKTNFQADMQGKTCVVTGCGADSIGEATALALAQRGARVLISTRQGAAERAATITQLAQAAGLPSAQIQGHDLDLLDSASTAAFAAWVQTQAPALDVLLNKRGTTWRALSDEQKQSAETQQGAVALMVAQPSLIKRPVLAYQQHYHAGFQTDFYATLFHKE